jgi:hypothetical protein
MRRQQQTGQNDRELIVSAGGCRRAAQGVQGQSSHGSFSSCREPGRARLPGRRVALLTRSGSAVGGAKDLLPSPRGTSCYSAEEEPAGRGSHVVHLVWSTSQRARSSGGCSACVGRSGPLCVFAWRVVGTVRCEHRGATRSQASVCVKQCGDRHAFGRGEQDSWESGNALSVRVLVTTPSTDLRPLATRTSAARRRTRARSAQTRCPARSRRSSGPRRSTDRRR